MIGRTVTRVLLFPLLTAVYELQARELSLDMKLILISTQ